MPDDLSKLTPQDPSVVDPRWTDARQAILGSVLTETPPRRSGGWRWLAGGAAAVLVVGAIGGIAQQVRHDQVATPASTSAVPAGEVELGGELMEVGGTMGICYGSYITSGQTDPNKIFPTRCEGGFLPVTGIDMPGFDDRNGTLVGSFDGSIFEATRWEALHEYQPFDPDVDGPLPPMPTNSAEPADICEAREGTGTTVVDELSATVEKLPGYQADWTVTDEDVQEQWLKEQGFGDSWSVSGHIPGDSYRIAVTQDAAAVQESLLAQFGVPLCVGTLPGPDAATVHAAAEAINAVFPRAEGELEPWVDARETMGSTGPGLIVRTLDATEEFRTRIEEAVGPEVWPSTDIQSDMLPVDPAIFRLRVRDPLPMPSGPAVPLVITDEDRSLAQESVATDLRNADGTSASATMAKATFEQYSVLWNFDWQSDLTISPLTPPAGDTEVLVVALSAPLTLKDVDHLPWEEPLTATATVTLIDATTSETLLNATISGGAPEARLRQLPGPIEDVALPEGFR